MSQERRRGSAATHPESKDASLRGRTYAVPFDTVWRAALQLAGGGLRRWTVTAQDDQDGVIHATSRSLAGAVHHITISISLDADAQTRVDAAARAEKPLTDMGRARRRVRRFFRVLDRTLERETRRERAQT